MILYADLKGSVLNLYLRIRADLRKLKEILHFYALSETECLVKKCSNVYYLDKSYYS